MKKVFAILAMSAMLMFAGACTCSNQKAVDGTVVESVDSAAVEVLEVADSTLTVVEE
jgi:hypothetical protein